MNLQPAHFGCWPQEALELCGAEVVCCCCCCCCCCCSWHESMKDVSTKTRWTTCTMCAIRSTKDNETHMRHCEMQSLFAHQNVYKMQFGKWFSICPVPREVQRPTDRADISDLFFKSRRLASYAVFWPSLSVSLSFNFRLAFSAALQIWLLLQTYCVYIYNTNILVYYLFGSTSEPSISLFKVYSCVLASFCFFLIPPQTLSQEY